MPDPDALRPEAAKPARPAAPRKPRRTPPKPVIPGYEVGEVIGRGAMGIVYRARQLIVQREVAIKVLHPELSGQERLVRRLQREARTTARLAHPHVVTAIDMGEVDGLWWYAMEYVDGPSLALRLRQEGRLSEREALRLFIPLVEALEHFYEHGVVHRDIKPANILVDRAGGAKLADLGLAFIDADPLKTGTGGTLGTPHYISPEQAVDASTADVRSDIWSFGATLYHALCGRPPFSGTSAAEILSAVLYSHVADPRELEPTLSKSMALVLRKCLTREPEGRYQTPRELLLDLERVRERRSVKVRRHSLDPVRHDGRARPLLLGAAAVLLTASGLAWYLGAFSPDDGAEAATTDTLPAYPALEELLVRARRDGENLAQHRGDLAALRETLPGEYVSAWEDVDRELTNRLRASVRARQNTSLEAIEAALDARDYAAASAALSVTFPADVYARTGYRLEELDGQGVSVAPWLEKQEERLEQRLHDASVELRGALETWSAGVRDRVQRLAEAQDWRAALEELDLDAAAILAAAGFEDVRLPKPYLGEAVDLGAQTALLLERERIREDWRRLDAELARSVKRRATTLLGELERTRPRLRAAASLESWFELELTEQRLSRDRMPVGVEGVAVACLDALDRRRRELAERERQLLEEDARADLAQTADVCTPLWRERRYSDARELWGEARLLLAELAERLETPGRADLERQAERRTKEAELLETLLQRAAERVRELDGQEVAEVRVGNIVYTDVRLDSGLDPLRDGFRVEGRERTVDLHRIAASQLVRFSGYDAEEGLDVEQHLALAAFLYHEGELEQARDVLHPELARSGLLAGLEADLERRVFDALERARERDDERTAVAGDYLELVFDESRQGRAPTNVVLLIDRLLGSYADLPQVQARRAELRSLRAQLVEEPDLTAAELLQKTLGPDRLEDAGLRRVRMEFDFEAESVGAWQHGDWVFDGRGWILAKETQDWEGLRQQNGPRLSLGEPLDPTKFVLELAFDAYSGPAQLLLVSVGGFHVALCGPGLPGSGQRSRYLVGTEGLDAFLARLRDGEGTEVPRLLTQGSEHRLRIEGYRRAGSYRVELDGELLRRGDSFAPRDEHPAIAIRSWEPIRIRTLALETGHLRR